MLKYHTLECNGEAISSIEIDNFYQTPDCVKITFRGRQGMAACVQSKVDAHGGIDKCRMRGTTAAGLIFWRWSTARYVTQFLMHDVV